MRRCFLTVAALITLTSAAHAQQPADDPLSTYLRQAYAAVSKDVLAVAEMMPEQDFGFRPAGVVKDVRTFGEILAHLALVDAFSCEMGDGRPPSELKADSALVNDKSRLIALLKDTDARCTAYLAKLTDPALSQIITTGKSPQILQAVRGNSLIFAIAHANEHYGNLVTYIRAKGLVPPAAAAQVIFLWRGTPAVAETPAQALVAAIQRADYEGDRVALQRLVQDAGVMLAVQPTASRLHYWRGFAAWRRALNGFNASADRREQESDLRLAVDEFDAAVAQDPAFVDAKIAKVSCLQNLTFLHQAEPATAQALIDQFVPLFKEAQTEAPNNPRLLWVQGASEWYTPPGSSAAAVTARHTAALASYERGLRMARNEKSTRPDDLNPHWGEPELLMNLAWSHLNDTVPDVRAAEDFARQALALVPNWHYVRDILMKQIQTAKGGR